MAKRKKPDPPGACDRDDATNAALSFASQRAVSSLRIPPLPHIAKCFARETFAPSIQKVSHGQT